MKKPTGRADKKAAETAGKQGCLRKLKGKLSKIGDKTEEKHKSGRKTTFIISKSNDNI